jgi:enoyl-CoA hydratase/carnithine racemase
MSDSVIVGPAAPGVALVALNRPPANFVDVEYLEEIVVAVESAADQRAIVLASEGKHFCAGAALAGGGAHAGSRGADGRHIYDVAIRLFEQPVPVVAAVQGSAIGAGLGLALAADFRVVTAGTRLAANFAVLGFHHGFGMSETLPRTVGTQKAAELLMTGRRVAGSEALDIGLADRLVGEAELRLTAITLASKLAAAAPLAVRSIRQTLRGDLAAAVRAAMTRERAEQDRLMRTSDFAEGVAAAKERRPPRFEGR